MITFLPSYLQQYRWYPFLPSLLITSYLLKYPCLPSFLQKPMLTCIADDLLHTTYSKPSFLITYCKPMLTFLATVWQGIIELVICWLGGGEGGGKGRLPWQGVQLLTLYSWTTKKDKIINRNNHSCTKQTHARS